jgi:hypothetical protein
MGCSLSDGSIRAWKSQYQPLTRIPEEHHPLTSPVCQSTRFRILLSMFFTVPFLSTRHTL